MPTASNPNPVAVAHPVTGQHIAVSKGDEFDDDHPFVTDPAYRWLFASSDVEQATAEPGEKRNVQTPCPEEGCDYSGSRRGLKIHTAQVHK